VNEPSAGHAHDRQLASPPAAAGRLARIVAIAAELGADDVAADAETEQRRLEEARLL